MRVSIKDIREMMELTSKINKAELSDMVFVEEDGIEVTPCPDVLEEWRFCGLSNLDFIRMDTYKCKVTMWDNKKHKD